MSIPSRVRAFAIVASLLPGLVLALPTPGGCAPCDRGEPCATMLSPEPAPAAHGCCADSAEPEVPGPGSDNARVCDCGRHTTPVIATAGTVAPVPDGGGVSLPIASDDIGGTPMTHTASARPPAPPPTQSIFLIDCAFLT